MSKRRLSLGALKLAAVGLVGYALLAAVIHQLSPGASGTTSSSYATAADGLAAYADLLTRSGYTVSRIRRPPAHATLSPHQTVVVLDPGLLAPTDVAALRRFVSAGGRLVIGGHDPARWLGGLAPDPPQWSDAGSTGFTTVVPIAENWPVRNVVSAGQGTWTDARGTLPVVSGTDGALLTLTSLGSGRIMLLADASPLQNSLLSSADNAAFGLGLAGPEGTHVAFEENVHGYGAQRGLAALPKRWKWALIGLMIAALTAVASRFRRLGPPEPQPIEPTPPRLEHVIAIASALRRTGKPADAAAPVQEHLRAMVCKRAALASDASSEVIATAALRLGLSEEEARVTAASTFTDKDVLTAGQALAKLSARGLAPVSR